MKLGDGKLPPFIGYLPPVVDGALLELANMSHPDYPPRRGRTGAQLAPERRLAIESVQRHFQLRSHQRAVDIVAGAMRSRTPFCLYLRNFGLGPRVYPARNDAFGISQVMTLMPTRFDLGLQAQIAAVVAPQVPALSIANPAGPTGELPAFVVGDDEWEELARTLVNNAGCIVLYFLSLTAGVADELALIRAAGKQSLTLVVIEDDDPFAATQDLATLFDARRGEPAVLPGSMDDFPHQVRHRRNDGWEAVADKLAGMPRMALCPPVDARIGLPLEFMPPESLRRYCTDEATREYDAAQQLMDQRRFDEAEDVLTRALAFACWGRDRLGQAMTLVALGQVNLAGFEAKGEAGAYFEMARDACGDMRATSPTAAQLYPAIEHALGQLRAQAQAKSRAGPDAAPGN